MATTQIAAKAKTKAAPPQASKSQGKEKPETKSREIVIPEIKSKAISKDVGPRFVKGLAKAEQDIAQGEQLVAAGEAAKANWLSECTLAVVKAVKADPTIDLTPAVSSDDGAKKKMSVMNDTLRIVLGISEIVTIKGKNGEDIRRVDYTAAVKEFFPARGENTDAGPGKAKANLRSNVAHALKKIAGAALTIVNRDMRADMDKSGVLRLSGPNVKKIYGMDNVLVNEAQKVIPVDKKGNALDPIELKEKPSFAGLQRRAQVEIGGKVVAPRSNNRTIKATTPDKAIIAIAKSLVDAVSNYKGNVTADMKAALEAVSSAIDPIL